MPVGEADTIIAGICWANDRTARIAAARARCTSAHSRSRSSALLAINSTM